MSASNEVTAWDRFSAAAAQRPGFVTLAFGLLGFALSLFWMRAGPTIPSGDSVAYLESARSLLESQQHGWLVWQLAEDGRAVPLAGRFEVNTIWPPGMSALLAGAMWAGVDIQLAVRGLVALFAGLAAAGGFAVSRLVTRSAAASIILTLLYLALFAVQWWVIESWMAEGLYLAVTFGGIVLFHRVATTANLSNAIFLPVGLLFSSVYYLKSIGPGFMMAAVASVLCLRHWPLRRRIICAGWLAAGCGVGAAPWLLRNLSLGTIGSGGLAAPDAVMKSLLDLGRLFVPRHGAFTESGRAVVMLGLFGLAVIGIVAALALPAGRAGRLRRLVARIEEAGPGAIFAVVYSLTFIAAVAAGVKLDKTGWVETRYWMEIGLFFLMFAWLAAQVGLAELTGLARHALRASVLVAGAVIAVANLAESARTASFTRLRVPDEPQRKRARAELVRMLSPVGQVAFVSNEQYRFGIETGVSASATVEEALRRTGETKPVRFVYVAYPAETKPTMALVSTPPAVPSGWKVVGIIGEAVIHHSGDAGFVSPVNSKNP
ncbi:MAG: hypothetical protein HZA92_08735 [Verrucomicrobia bacterium]|nr:hypothetical protein [Verrucomicrobiota bacterium]